jgi:RNA binding exosome subunit
MKGSGTLSKGDADDSTIASGLKEALSIGTQKGVNSVSRTDGYFGNQMIKILMPEKIQKVGEVLRKVGYEEEVDEFVLSMNRAAEKAAPQAMSFFVDAIKGMTFEDARGILNGGDTSATEFFKKKTHDKIYNAFKPIISSSMDEVGVTRSYKEMMGKYETIPFMSEESVDLDHYVTTKAMDGLFYMVGQEEKKIRTDPAAQVTDLLKSVFGK